VRAARNVYVSLSKFSKGFFKAGSFSPLLTCSLPFLSQFPVARYLGDNLFGFPDRLVRELAHGLSYLSGPGKTSLAGIVIKVSSASLAITTARNGVGGVPLNIVRQYLSGRGHRAAWPLRGRADPGPHRLSPECCHSGNGCRIWT
jgi:hypothetical protein